ncbi:hypothetical protein [Dokdonella fugitiva]|uniref:hypothetical protein n=1 Tax=Dokdonella fugitiva TaxID=328517 RepID=UPI001F53FCB7|nr:hypothetical protein [Dokdonella fugitiva]
MNFGGGERRPRVRASSRPPAAPGDFAASRAGFAFACPARLPGPRALRAPGMRESVFLLFKVMMSLSFDGSVAERVGDCKPRAPLAWPARHGGPTGRLRDVGRHAIGPQVRRFR